GTPLLTPDGSKPIELFKVGDLVLSREEHNPDGPVVPKRVEEIFVRTGRILQLRLGGQVIQTTPEHPFFVKGEGWRDAGLLHVGDLLYSHDGKSVTLEELLDTGEYATVYNMRVADYHTYFVGILRWGFSVWAHNAPCDADLEGRSREWREYMQKKYGDRAVYKVPGTPPVDNLPAPP